MARFGVSSLPSFLNKYCVNVGDLFFTLVLLPGAKVYDFQKSGRPIEGSRLKHVFVAGLGELGSCFEPWRLLVVSTGS